MTGHALRDRFRAYALDGAQHYFHPQSGTHVRIAGPRTRDARRTAPRVVMFGVTNECNLACRFCSRDTRRPSLWTVESAFHVLRDLSRTGVLEVAFGGGEPFAFPQFDALIGRLHEETPLALNVTTNGTVLDRSMWAPFAGRLGQVRVSIYGDATWRRCAELFATTGQLWGANVLVDDAALASLEETLADLAAAGCHDVSLLGYVGEPARLLSPEGRRRLARIARASPLPCRVSVCFGGGLGVPRLLAGFDNEGDCGAGADFITVTPDQRVQSCSFQESGFPGATAEEILSTWRRQRSALAQPSPRSGCARLHPAGEPVPLLPISIWQGFSGNNSGECIMVAKFQTVEDARGYLDELLPAWTARASDDRYPAEWKELFAREQVAGASMTHPDWDGDRQSPDHLVQIGKSVIASGHGLGDNFPELRALAWKRGAYVVPGGIHVHETTRLLGAIAARDDADRSAVEEAIWLAGMEPSVHGRVVFVPILETAGGERLSLTEQRARLIALAADRPVAAEIARDTLTNDDIVDALKHLGEDQAEHWRLWVSFWPTDTGHENARRLAATLSNQRVLLESHCLLVDPVQGRKRVAVLSYRHDGGVTALNTERVIVKGWFWRERIVSKGRKVETPPVNADTLRTALARHGLAPRDPPLHLAPTQYGGGVALHVLTGEPGPAMTAVASAAKDLDLSFSLGMSEPLPIRALFRRLRADLESRRGDE